ncbi:13278_t:CDS:2 [Entrophospora sp. SA101]|nr:13278_t:CDS:2 [Entrophospora sp. SA101]
MDFEGSTGLDHPGEKKVVYSNTIDETSEERRRRLNREQQQHETSEECQQILNCEQQQCYRKNKRNMDSEGSTGLDQFLDPSFSITSEDNVTTPTEQEVVIPLTTVPLKTLKTRIIHGLHKELPYPLNTLLTRTDPSARLFRKNIRLYNSALTFTSMGAKVDHSITGTSGIYSFRVHGEMYYSVDTILPDNEVHPQFAQIYVYDTEHELQNRMNVMPNLDLVSTHYVVVPFLIKPSNQNLMISENNNEEDEYEDSNTIEDAGTEANDCDD